METPQILEAVQQLDAEWIDRGAVERLFRVKRRQALYLMAAMGGAKRFGTAWLVERSSVIQHLKAILDSPGFQSQVSRRQKLERALAAEKGREVPIDVAPEELKRTTLPDGVALEPNRLTVQFEDLPELLARLYGVAMAMANNFERFSNVIANGKHTDASAAEAG